MRKIVVTEFIALDGVIDSPLWSMAYWNDEIAAFKDEEQHASDALLLGRVTYEGFAAAWPESEDEGAEIMNGIRKYVVSNTLENASWNNSQIISGDAITEIAALKQGDGGDLLVYGSGKLIQALIASDMVDTYRLLVYPVVVGSGRRLFEEGATTTLELVEAKPMGGGVMAMIYQPKRG